MDSDRAGLRKCGARGSRGLVCGGSKGRGLGRGCAPPQRGSGGGTPRKIFENDLCGDAILAYFCDQFALIVSIYNLSLALPIHLICAKCVKTGTQQLL